MKILIGILLLPVGLLSQTPERAATSTPQVVQRGSDGAPVSVRLLNTGKTDDEARQDRILSYSLFGFTAFQSIILLMAMADTRKTARTQQRAYVLLDRITCLEPDVKYPQVATYEVTVRNSGQTPAHDVRIVTGLYIAPSALKTPVPVPPAASWATTDTIPAGNSNISQIPEFRLSPEEMKFVQAGELTVYLHGTIRYRDVFGKKHFSNFRHFRLPNSYLFAGSEQGNEAS